MTLKRSDFPNLPAGKTKIEVETTSVEPKAGGPVTAALLFTANDCLDIGSDLGSPVSVDYFDDAPFRFSGKIEQIQMKYLQEPAGKPL